MDRIKNYAVYVAKGKMIKNDNSDCYHFERTDLSYDYVRVFQTSSDLRSLKQSIRTMAKIQEYYKVACGTGTTNHNTCYEMFIIVDEDILTFEDISINDMHYDDSYVLDKVIRICVCK
jgi:hypothetical protein